MCQARGTCLFALTKRLLLTITQRGLQEMLESRRGGHPAHPLLSQPLTSGSNLPRVYKRDHHSNIETAFSSSDRFKDLLIKELEKRGLCRWSSA